MTLSIIFLSVSLIIFIVWQVKLLMKYSFAFDRFKIDTASKIFCINDKSYAFDDVEYVTVVEKQQPALYERLLSKAATFNYMADIVFHMKDNTVVTCAFNHKAQLSKTLSMLQPYFRIDSDIEKYQYGQKSRYTFAVFYILMIIVLSWILIVMKP